MNTRSRRKAVASPPDSTAVAEAERAGFDMSLVEASLSHCHEKRARQHQAALELALELENAGRRRRGDRS